MFKEQVELPVPGRASLDEIAAMKDELTRLRKYLEDDGNRHGAKVAKARQEIGSLIGRLGVLEAKIKFDCM